MHPCIGIDRTRLYLPRGIDQRHLQRGSAILPDRGWLPTSCLSGTEECGWLERAAARVARFTHAFLERIGQSQHKSAWCGRVQPGDGLGIRAFLWLLVYGF